MKCLPQTRLGIVVLTHFHRCLVLRIVAFLHYFCSVSRLQSVHQILRPERHHSEEPVHCLSHAAGTQFMPEQPIYPYTIYFKLFFGTANLRAKVLEWGHTSMTCLSSQGLTGLWVCTLLWQWFWWPSLEEDVCTCISCSQHKP